MTASLTAKSMTGTEVQAFDDDSDCPLTGIVTGVIDDEFVRVAWGDDRDAAEPDRWALRTAIDELRPVKAEPAPEPLAPAVEHSSTGICTLAPKRPHADVGICRACLEQGLFDALLNDGR